MRTVTFTFYRRETTTVEASIEVPDDIEDLDDVHDWAHDAIWDGDYIELDAQTVDSDLELDGRSFQFAAPPPADPIPYALTTW